MLHGKKIIIRRKKGKEYGFGEEPLPDDLWFVFVS
jgi:hypothetical protein